MAWPAGPKLAGFASAPWGRRAWSRESTSGPLLSGAASQTPRAREPHGRAERVGRRRLQSPQQVARPTAAPRSASLEARRRHLRARPSTGHLPPRPFPSVPAAGRQGSVVKPGPGNFTRGNSRGALRRRRLSVSLGGEATAAAKEAAAAEVEEWRQWLRGPVRGEPRGRDGEGQR